MVNIDSRKKWNDTGIDVLAGRRYSYRATGHWKDWYIECDANGFTHALMDLSSWMKRDPSARWFQLIGAVNQNVSKLIKLGTVGAFVAPQSGRLWAFANDAGFAYGNNSGSLQLSIQEDA